MKPVPVAPVEQGILEDSGIRSENRLAVASLLDLYKTLLETWGQEGRMSRHQPMSRKRIFTPNETPDRYSTS